MLVLIQEVDVAVILIVEDEEQVRVLAESYLQSTGHMTLSASTIEQAIALLESNDKVDVLFTDLNLHGDIQGGLALATKAAETKPGLRVLYTSGQGVTDGMIALFVPNSAYLPKPYTVEQLGTMLSMRFDVQSAKSLDGKKPPQAVFKSAADEKGPQ